MVMVNIVCFSSSFGKDLNILCGTEYMVNCCQQIRMVLACISRELLQMQEPSSIIAYGVFKSLLSSINIGLLMLSDNAEISEQG